MKYIQCASSVVSNPNNSMLEDVYATVILKLITHLEELCHSDIQHSQIFRLENYHFFFAAMEVRKYPLLHDYVNQVENLFLKSLKEYCNSLLNENFQNQLTTLSQAQIHINSKGYEDLQFHINKTKFINVFILLYIIEC